MEVCTLARTTRESALLLNILVFTRNMDRYRGAFYQSDFLLELSRQHRCLFYGPGFTGFTNTDSLDTVIEKAANVPDVIVVAHSWLADNLDAQLEPMPRLDLSQSSSPVVFMLNKEYSRLSEKLDWAENNRVSLLFSHHHEIGKIVAGRNLETRFMPFAYSDKRFLPGGPVKKYDFGFTGILKNPVNSSEQGEIRAQVMNVIFKSIRHTPLLKRKKYRMRKVFWRSWKGNSLWDRLMRLIVPRPSEEAYISILGNTKVWLNGPSPLGLISTRFFECMASGSVVLTARTPGLNQIFPDGTFVEFDNIQSFEKKLHWLLENEEIARGIAARAKTCVENGHTWRHRIFNFTSEIVRLKHRPSCEL